MPTINPQILRVAAFLLGFVVGGLILQLFLPLFIPRPWVSIPWVIGAIASGWWSAHQIAAPPAGR